MKLHIDWTLCDGRGLCVELLPELLIEDDWGFPAPRTGSRNDIEFSDDVRGYVQRAISQCPRSALRLRA
jgi:ferredoxin